MALAPQATAAGTASPAALANPVPAPRAALGAVAPSGGGVPAAVPGAANSGGIANRVRSIYDQPAVRRALPGIVALAILIVFGVVYAMMQATPYRAVMPGMAEADQQAAFDILTKAEFKPRVDKTSGQLAVPADRYHEARILLASQGVPKAGAMGLDALKDHSSMTTSQFMEQVRVNAAMEQELARSITNIGTVQSARVHLATPKQSAFVRERTPPKAAVVVTPHAGRVVSAAQVQAIVHLVSSSVPYLAPDQVTVVDNFGKLLTESATELKLGLTSAQTQHKQQLEETYRSRIQQILAPVVGEANVRSQVNLVLDFTHVESTTEDFDTKEKGPKTRSEVLAEDRGTKRDAQGVPGGLANAPPPDPAATPQTNVDPNRGQAESSDKLSSRVTRNYELDRTVRHVKNASGGVKRLSVAVVINERAAPATAAAPAAAAPAQGQAAGAAAPKAGGYAAEELERLQDLVRQVVGYDKERGDVVTLVPARFEPAPAPEATPWYLDPELHSMARYGLVALLFLVFLLIVVRPLMRTIARHAEPALELAESVPDGELSDEDVRLIQLGEGDSIEEIKAKLRPRKTGISADMLDTANTYDDKVALIRVLVVEDSARVANVLKNMIKAG